MTNKRILTKLNYKNDVQNFKIIKTNKTFNNYLYLIIVLFIY